MTPSCCPARSAWRSVVAGRPGSRSTRCRRWRRRRATPHWSPGRPRGRPSTSYAGWSCCSTTGACSRRASCAAAASPCATSRRWHASCTSTSPGAALVVEVALTAGLIAEAAAADGTPSWLPTDEFDLWSGLPLAERWTRLVGGWLASSRVPSLVGSRDPAGKSWNALAPELSSGLAEEARRLALQVLAEVPEGEVLAIGTGIASLVQRIAWLRPRRPTIFADLVTAALAEAAALGVTGAGGLPPSGRHVAGGDLPAAAAAIAADLPRPVDHVLLQADLTAVAPGRSRRRWRARLHLLADVESRGGATVYRFTSGSLRRGFDAGWSSGEVRDFLTTVSQTPGPPAPGVPGRGRRPHLRHRAGRARRGVPARRRRGRARRAGARPAAGAASAFACSPRRCDRHLPARRPAPPAPRAGRRPGRRGRRRHRPREPPRPAAGPRPPRPPPRRRRRGRGRRRRSRRWRRPSAAGDRAESSRPASAEATTTPTGALAALREAIEAGSTVVIGYVDGHGANGGAGRRPAPPRRRPALGATTTAADDVGSSPSTASPVCAAPERRHA